ncbi:movement protein 1 [Gompholobium virus A]|uniref:Movement protein 1 n=1 Tax=Gompholobium virus A TaxID=1884832 RepID=A0A1B2ARY6_9TOMB|nr:movement protein 1 [Gompholobium virus A]ANY30825.1 movement protein 1 [Gompholobium virus A]
MESDKPVNKALKKEVGENERKNTGRRAVSRDVARTGTTKFARDTGSGNCNFIIIAESVSITNTFHF